jgi:hypothetical protein
MHPAKTRGALGVAVIGSITATTYATAMRGELVHVPTLTDTDRGLLSNNVGAAIHASRQLGAQGNQSHRRPERLVDSMRTSLWIAAGLAVGAANVAATQLPPPRDRPRDDGAARCVGRMPLDPRKRHCGDSRVTALGRIVILSTTAPLAVDNKGDHDGPHDDDRPPKARRCR